MVNEKKMKSMEKGGAGSVSQKSRAASSVPMLKFEKTILQTDYIFKLSLDEMTREISKLNSNIFSTSYLRQTPFEPVYLSDDDQADAITTLTSMSNMSTMPFRPPHFTEETKYIKEPQPYGNPFKLLIRPKNQVIQMSEIEDEAFMTTAEKKKSNRLASYANLYKQQSRNHLKKYGEWFRANQDPTTLELRLKELMARQQEERAALQRKEEEILKNGMHVELSFLEKRELQESEQADAEEAGYTLLKPEKLGLKGDTSRHRASCLLFDDLQEVLLRFAPLPVHAEELQLALRNQMRLLSTKFQDCFEPKFLARKLDEFVSNHFGYSF
jgi:hypothetical protein